MRLKFKNKDPVTKTPVIDAPMETMSTSKMPCAFDTRRLRITIFPEHPQTILLYVPEGQRLWLPPLETPFTLDTVSDALDDHDVPHDTREGDRNRWWQNIKQSESDDKAELSSQRRLDQAARTVKIHLSAAATTLKEKQVEIFAMKHKVDSEIRQIKVDISDAKSRSVNGIYEPPAAFRQRQQHLADLQTASLALQIRLSEVKDQLRVQRQLDHEQRQLEDNRRFVEKAKRFLTKDQYLAIWDEIHAEDRDKDPAHNEALDKPLTD